MTFFVYLVSVGAGLSEVYFDLILEPLRLTFFFFFFFFFFCLSQHVHGLRKACPVGSFLHLENINPGFVLTSNFQYLSVKISIHQKTNQLSFRHTGCYFV